jgi:hypothetical protein
LPQTFIFPSQSFELGLVLVDPPLLLLLSLPLSHELITDQCAGNQTYGAADERAYCGVPHRTANDRAAASPEPRADKPALLSCGKRRSTSGRKQGRQDTR